MKRRLRAQAGVALIEFAVALPLLMVLLIGILEVGRMAYYNVLVGNAAHAGAMYGSQSTHTAEDTANITAAALADGQNVPQLSVSPAPTYSCECYNNTTNTSTSLSCFGTTSCPAASHRIMYVQVTATARVNTLFNYGILGLPNPWIITRTATMRVANTTQ